MAEQSDYQKIREPLLRSAIDNCSQAMREKAETVFLRQAKECRERACALIEKSRSLENMARVASVMSPEDESYLYELAIRSNPAFN